MRFFPKLSVAVFLSLLVASCSTPDDVIPTENRISLVDSQESNLKKSNVDIQLSEAIFNVDWTQNSGLPFNDVGNLKAIDNFSNVKKVYIGETKDGYQETTMQPVIAAGKAFFFDVDSRLTALDLETNTVIWRNIVNVQNGSEGNPRGGGLATDGANVFITTSNGVIAAYNTETGKKIWRVNNKVPISAAPTLSQGILFVVDRANRLQVFEADTGRPLWDYRGLPEPATYTHVAGASVFGAVLIIPFTSGELTAINIKDQKPAWGQTLTSHSLNSTIHKFNTISGEIIIANRNVYTSIPSGMTMALKGQTGHTLWKNDIGSDKTMLSVGNVLYVIDTNAVLYALSKADGGVIWKRQLPKYQDVDNQEDIITWTAPIMSNGNIVMFSNTGTAFMIDSKDGSVIERNDDAPETIINPMIAGGKLYLHAKDGYVYIYSNS